MVCKFYFDTKEVTGMFIKEEDYLKVVEGKEHLETLITQLNVNNINYKEMLNKEKDNLNNQIGENNRLYEENESLKDNLKRVQNHLLIKVQECKEKDEEIEKLKDQLFNPQIEEIANFLILNGLAETDKIISDCTINVIKKLIEEKQILKDKLDEWEYVEETWTLKYIYDVDGVVKEYEQNGMIKEDAEELIGMDSDNWNFYSLTKEERPDKDKIIEGLIIRAESGEEVIKELEEKLESIEFENKQLRNDHRLKIGLSDRRA